MTKYRREEKIRDCTANFKERSVEWRIQAVIHDGSWYDVKKWARMAKVKKEDVETWIRKNQKTFHLIKKDDSYRVSKDEVLKWYSRQEGFTIKDRIVPKNFPPRIWNDNTEVEGFLEIPRRKTASVTFECEDDKLLKKIKLSLSGIARVRKETSGKYRAFGLSDDYIKHTLEQSLKPKEIQLINMKRRKGMFHRELTDFPPEFTESALMFYIPFARNILKPHMSTLTIYLESEDDIKSQIITWIVNAMRKFDETKPVPFSGYLSSVLRFWPYDLPDEFLGKELSNFQRKRSSAQKNLEKQNKGKTNFSNEELAKEMDWDLDDFIKFDTQHRTWLAERQATTLNWSDSANEKSGELIGYSQPTVHDVSLASKISIAVLNATLKSSKFDDGISVINLIDSDMTNLESLSDLSMEFKTELAKELQQMGEL